MSSSVSSLIKPLLGPSNGIWCFNKRSSAPSCFILSQKMFTQLWTYLLVNTVPAFSNKLSDKPFEGFWQTGPVYPISFFFKLFPDTIFLVQENSHSPVHLLLLFLMRLDQRVQDPSFKGGWMSAHCTSDPHARTADTTRQACEGPAWRTAGSRSGRRGTAWSPGSAEGQETPCTFQRLSEPRWQLGGAEMAGGSEGTSVHQLCASSATVQSGGSLCLFTRVASLTRAQTAQPSEMIPVYVQLFKLQLVFTLSQTLGKGSEVLGS